MADRTTRIFANNPIPPSPTGMTYGDVMGAKVNPVVQKALSIPNDAAAVIKKANDALQNYGNEGRSVPVPIVSQNYGNEGRSVPVPKLLINDENNSTSAIPNIDESMTADGYRVRLYAVRNFPQGERVIFDVTPTLSESRTVEYATVAPIHLPGSIQIYKRTGARTFSLGAKLVSRNQAQATENIRRLQLLRGWCMPYFGISDRSNERGHNKDAMLGAPPDVLYLYAYSSGSGGSNRAGTGAIGINLKKIPVVITGMNLDYPEDCDYIPTADGDPFPVKMEVKLDLLETHSPGGENGYETFSLTDFKNGRLVQF